MSIYQEMIERVHRDSDITAIREVLKGDLIKIGDAFTWDYTPQGYEYWRRKYDRLEIAPEDQQFLESILRYRDKVIDS